MNILSNKKILVVICGGISAYKSLELIRGLKKKQVEIKTIITKSAREFVTPLSITSLSQGKVYEDLFSSESESEMDHISLSRWADLIIVVPATANTISKLSNGLTDDLASTVLLASNKKIFIVPAMNVRMWDHPSNKKNIIKYRVLKPGGRFLCLEFSKIQNPNLDFAYKNYSKLIPYLGKFIVGDKKPYEYLVKSIENFINQEELIELLKNNNFQNCSYRNLSGGIVAIHSGWKL